MAGKKASDPKALLVRVPLETYLALQLSHPFVGVNSMQDLLAELIDQHIAGLMLKDPGYERAVQGLRESTARADGVLARRAVKGDGPSL